MPWMLHNFDMQAWGRARYWYRRAAKQGFGKAAHNLGELCCLLACLLSIRGPSNTSHVFAPPLFIDPGLMAMQGMAGPMEDADTAFKWWSVAAADGMGISQRNLGILYESGAGCPQN